MPAATQRSGSGGGFTVKASGETVVAVPGTPSRATVSFTAKVPPREKA